MILSEVQLFQFPGANTQAKDPPATFKVLCTSPEAANHLLRGHIHIADQLVNIHKDLCQPIRCIKCQEYGHIRDTCINVKRCAICASEIHITNTCGSSNHLK